MRFVVDECTGPGVARWLRHHSHDVLSIYDDARGVSDEEVIRLAVSEQRILITNDRDFGEMIFRARRRHCGVVYLRLRNERLPSKIAAIEDLMRRYHGQLAGRFVVVTESLVRFSEQSP